MLPLFSSSSSSFRRRRFPFFFSGERRRRKKKRRNSNKFSLFRHPKEASSSRLGHLFTPANSHLREVGATSSTRGRDREAGAQEGGTRRRLFFFYVVLERKRKEIPPVVSFWKSSPGGTLRSEFRSTRDWSLVSLMLMIGRWGWKRAQEELKGETRGGGGFFLGEEEEEEASERADLASSPFDAFPLTDAIFVFSLARQCALARHRS